MKKHYTLHIEQDTDAPNPREEYYNLWKKVIFRGNYDYQSDTDMQYLERYSSDEIQEFLENGSEPVLMWYPLERGLSLGDLNCDVSESGIAGVFLLYYEDFIKEYGTDTEEHRQQALRVAEAELKTYMQYCNGEVYGYVIKEHLEDEDGSWDEDEDEVVDSLWGMYGYDYCKQEGQAQLEWYEAEAEKEFNERYTVTQ